MNFLSDPSQNFFLSIGSHRFTGPVHFTQSIVNNWGGLFTIAGYAEFRLDGKVLTTSAGDLVLYPPGPQHVFHSSGEWQYIWFHFSLRPHVTLDRVFRPDENFPSAGKIHFEGVEKQKIQDALEEAFELEHFRADRPSPLAELLVESVIQRVCDRMEKPASRDPRIRKAQKILLADFSADMDSVARQCGMSHTAFYNLFRKETGHSPREFREFHWIEWSKTLLECTDLPLQQIARQIGIADPFYFSARFKKQTGYSPSLYRKEIRRNKCMKTHVF